MLLEYFSSSATVRSAKTKYGRFVLACFPQKVLEGIDLDNNDKSTLTPAILRRIPDFSVLVIPEKSSNSNKCGWFRPQGVVSFIVEVKSGYSDQFQLPPWRGRLFPANEDIIWLFTKVADLRQIFEQAQAAVRSQSIPFGLNGKQRDGIKVRCMLIVAVWFACFEFEPAFLDKDVDEALHDMMADMASFCYCTPAAIFNSQWTKLSTEFLTALRQCTFGYPTEHMFKITPHAFFQAPQPDLPPDPQVCLYVLVLVLT